MLFETHLLRVYAQFVHLYFVDKMQFGTFLQISRFDSISLKIISPVCMCLHFANKIQSVILFLFKNIFCMYISLELQEMYL